MLLAIKLEFCNVLIAICNENEKWMRLDYCLRGKWKVTRLEWYLRWQRRIERFDCYLQCKWSFILFWLLFAIRMQTCPFWFLFATKVKLATNKGFERFDYYLQWKTYFFFVLINICNNSLPFIDLKPDKLQFHRSESYLWRLMRFFLRLDYYFQQKKYHQPCARAPARAPVRPEAVAKRKKTKRFAGTP